ncbi:hypothetical protein Dsin_030438 [Dipteronia sinensis]|uniref:Uncharacterized protein n=1 Tax=Dipteronia sinensis TaxID=43782 RepID=A0AAE0DRB2_9ROSI|nr:hypothetical protein Dsin_030438 [Dipteronia sinensis]
MGLGSGAYHSCQIKETERETEALKLDLCGYGFTFKGIEYRINDFVYLSPDNFAAEDKDQGTFKGGRNAGLKAYVVCQLLGIEVSKERGSAKSTKVRFGILEAGTYGVSQSRKCAFIWAASHEEQLPEWPGPMHVFASLGLKVKLSEV